MTNRYPLIIDAQTQRIRELPAGDNLDLTGNSISSVRDILPESSEAYDLGSELNRWRDLYLSGNSIYLGSGIISYDSDLEKFIFSSPSNTLDVDNLEITVLQTSDIRIEENRIQTTQSDTNLELNTAGVGSIELLTTTNIIGDLGVTGNFTVGGNIVLGNEVVDNITVIADFTSNLIPNQTDTYDLGSIDKNWKNGYFTNVNATVKITSPEVNADIIADDLTVMVDVSTNSFTGDLTAGTIDVNTQADIAALFVENLTAGRITISGTDGKLEDSANLTFGIVGVVDTLTVNGDQKITGNLSVDGNISLGGNITIGNETLDSVTVNADFTSDLIPNESNQYSLGSATQKWKNLYVRAADVRQTLKIGTDEEISVDVITDAATVNLFNTTATTINGFGTATDINIGANIGTTTINNDLVVEGTVTANGGSVLSTGSGIDQVTTYTKSITLTRDWQDTGIKSTDLATGTYFIQLYANDVAAGGTNSNEYYSGIMSWYSGTTDSSVESPTDEIVLHRAGASSDAGMYLRTFRTKNGNPDNLKLQIYSNTVNPSSANYVFKFRRAI